MNRAIAIGCLIIAVLALMGAGAVMISASTTVSGSVPAAFADMQPGTTAQLCEPDMPGCRPNPTTP